MAIIGARPVHPWYLGWRNPRTTRARARRAGTRLPSRGAAQGVRVRRRVETRSDIRPLLLGIVLAAGLAFFYLSQSTRVAATGYDIDRLEATLAEHRAAQQQLVLAIGKARSPSEITDRARNKLNLVPLDEGAVQFVRGKVNPPPHWSTIDH